MPKVQIQTISVELSSLRIDKWLWAARFYKTRSLASEAIKSGKVTVDGERIKASKEIHVGDLLTIKQGITQTSVIVLAVSTRRGPASVANTLYCETADSIQKREKVREILRAQPALRQSGQGRPTKRERRHIISFTSKRQS